MERFFALSLYLLAPMALYSQGNDFGPNLILNPGAESGSLANWTQGTPNAPQIIAWNNGSSEYANLSSPIPEAEYGVRGDYYFMGGYSGGSTSMYQDVDLSFLDWSQLSDASFSASAWIGGWYIQRDHALVRFDFFSGSELLSSYSLTTVTKEDRKDVTMFLYRDEEGSIPQGADRVRVTVDFVFLDGGWTNDAYVDNLVFSVATTAIPESSTWVLLVSGLALGGAALKRFGRRNRDS